jgi:hypothetical protein
MRNVTLERVNYFRCIDQVMGYEKAKNHITADNKNV